MWKKLALCLLVLGLGDLLGEVRARAQVEPSGPAPVNTTASLNAGARDDAAADGTVRPTGTYTGVLPGGSQPPAVPVPPGQTPTTITWPGFQMRPDGTSRVFVQSSAPVQAQSSLLSNKFSVRLAGARIAGDTNRLPLETRFFNTPASRITITTDREGVTLHLELRAQVVPQVSTEQGASGYYFTYVDLPAGNYLPPPADKPEAQQPHGGAPAQPQAAPVATQEPPDYLDETPAPTQPKADAQVKASAGADTSKDHELPPGIKAGGQAQGGVKLGK